MLLLCLVRLYCGETRRSRVEISSCCPVEGARPLFDQLVILVEVDIEP